MPTQRPWISLLELLASGAGFLVVSWSYSRLDADWALSAAAVRSLAISTAVFWLTWQAYAPVVERGWLATYVERTSVGAGINLIVQAVLVYTFVLDFAAPAGVMVLGSALSGALILPLAARIPSYARARVLLVGCDGMQKSIARSLGSQVIGVLEHDPSQVAPGLPYSGSYRQIGDVISAQRPDRIVISFKHQPGGSLARGLLQARLSGVTVEHAAQVYELLFRRVYLETVRPFDLPGFTALTMSRPVMAVQAVYSNLVGLTLFVPLSPLILFIAVLARLASGPGPLFESVECDGFQGIPFRRLRFRRHKGNGQLSWAGQAITRFRLANLPQLFNIVRGEMALFGPAPVRAEFAARLRELLPPSAHRLAIKPGLMSWARTEQAYAAGHVLDEIERLEYDLYYIKECVPSLDFEIFLRGILKVIRHTVRGHD